MKQKKTIEVRGVQIGTGIPKICVPIVERTTEELFKNKRVKVEKENTEKNKNEIIKYEKIGLFQKILRKLKIFLSKSLC